MNKHSVTLNNGRIETRNSKSRTYTHAVVAVVTEETVAHYNGVANPSAWWLEQAGEMTVGNDFGVMAWSGSRELAEKAAASQQRPRVNTRGFRYEVRPVTMT